MNTHTPFRCLYRWAVTPAGPLLAFAALALAPLAHAADVVVDSAQTFQTIAGWGHGGGILGGVGGPHYMLGPATADAVNYQYMDYLLDDYGLIGTRTWEVGPRIDGTTR